MSSIADSWPPLPREPFISVVLPVRNEERYIEQTLRQLLNQDYPVECFELLVCDGMSNDHTRKIVQRLAQEDPRVRLLDNPRRRSSAGRNLGFRTARGEISVVIDGHVLIPDDQLLANIARLFHSSQAACLGRPQPLLATSAGSMSEAIAHARKSWIAHSQSSFINSQLEGFAPAASMGAAYRRELFNVVGYVDETFDACEDLEFNTRIDAAGMRCFTSPSLTVRYFARDSLVGLFKQMRRYGHGRLKYLLRHPSTLSITQLVPFFFVVGLITLPLFVLLSWPLFLFGIGGYLLYLLIVLTTALQLARRTSWRHFPRYLAIFPTIHIGLGAGFLWSMLRRGRTAPHEVTSGDRAS